MQDEYLRLGELLAVSITPEDAVAQVFAHLNAHADANVGGQASDPAQAGEAHGKGPKKKK